MKVNRLRVERWLEDIYRAGAPPFGYGQGGLGEKVKNGVFEEEGMSAEELRILGGGERVRRSWGRGCDM